MTKRATPLLLITVLLGAAATAAPTTATMNVTAEGDSVLFWADTTFTMEPVTVKAARLQAGQVHVVETASLREAPSTNVLATVTRQVPGMFLTERGISGYGVAGGSAGKIFVRGVGGTQPNNRVLVMIDGQPQVTGLFGHPIPDLFLSPLVDRVEVVRGPASVIYGSNAMGGVVNVHTRRPAASGLTLEASSRLGSYQTMTHSLATSLRRERIYMTASYAYDATDGHRPNSSYRQNSSMVRLGYRINDTFTLDATANVSQSRSHDPGPVDAPVSGHWFDVMRMNTGVTLQNRGNVVSGAMKWFYGYGEHQIYDGFDSSDLSTGITLYQTLHLGRNLSATAGADWRNYGGEVFSIAPPGRTGEFFVRQASAFAVVQSRPLEWLSLNTGARLEDHSIYGAELIPQAAATAHLTDRTELRVSGSKGYRAPYMNELYLFPPSTTDLEPEHMWTWEAGVEHRVGAGTFLEATLFQLQGDNIIRTEGVPPSIRFVNSGDFTHSGVELAANTLIGRTWLLRGAYSYVNNDGNTAQNPRHQLNLAAEYRRGAFDARVSMHYVSELYAYDDMTMRLPDYNLLGARVAYRPMEGLELFFAGRNLLDWKYEIADGYVMPGVTVHGGLSYRTTMLR